MPDGLALKMALARAVGSVSRRRGGGGTSAPGKVLLRLAPDAITTLGRRLSRGSVVLSATNGKTTTATLAAGVLRGAGMELVHNRTGANMAGGVAAALLDAARPGKGGGAALAELGLFEVDELWLAPLMVELEPHTVVLSNLFRDQLDRYGELEAIADSWQQAVASSGARLVLNADDPVVADLGRDRPDVLYFGVEDDALALAGLAHAADAKHCRRCGAPYVFDAVYLGHLGHYHCPNCGRRRPAPAVTASAVRLEGVSAARFVLRTPAGEGEVRLELPGLYNVYNALAAAALATALEVPFEKIVAGLHDARAAFGRGERLRVPVRDVAPGANAAAGAPGQTGADSPSSPPSADRELRILLVKNPAGANEVLRTLALEPGEHELLGVLNDRIADGRDVSWIWDADFELLSDRIAAVTCSGTRAADLATRLKYAGVAPQRIRVEPTLEAALDRALAGAGAPGGQRAPLYALPTYTAMLALRELLVARGVADSAWR